MPVAAHIYAETNVLIAVAETIRAISLGLRDTLRKPTEAALFDNYGRLCMVVDEVINEASNAVKSTLAFNSSGMYPQEVSGVVVFIGYFGGC